MATAAGPSIPAGGGRFAKEIAAMANKSLLRLLETTDHCIVAPCVYDCASARAVAATWKAARACSSVTPSISKRMGPG